MPIKRRTVDVGAGRENDVVACTGRKCWAGIKYKDNKDQATMERTRTKTNRSSRRTGVDELEHGLHVGGATKVVDRRGKDHSLDGRECVVR